MYLKFILLVLCLYVCVSCTLFRYYHASYEFKERTYNPIKKGRIELTVHGETTYSERPGAITSYERAYNKGLNRAKQSIKQFCEGPYIIKTIAEKKENLGTRTDTSYFSDHSSQREHYTQGAYKDYGVADSYNTMSKGLRGRVRGGAYAQSGLDSRYGYSDSHATTQTAPVFREWTDITFQCK